MGRPRKTGIDYFPFDVDFFSDKKIKILKSRFGVDGITVYLYLLCEIYRNGYYIEYDDDYTYIIADDLGMSGEKVKQVLSYLLERSLLTSILLLPVTVITSHGIQCRFQEAVKGRAAKSGVEVDKQIWLLNEQETLPFIKYTQNSVFSENNGSFSEKNQSKSEIYAIKESKVNNNACAFALSDHSSDVSSVHSEELEEEDDEEMDLNEAYRIWKEQREKAMENET